MWDGTQRRQSFDCRYLEEPDGINKTKGVGRVNSFETERNIATRQKGLDYTGDAVLVAAVRSGDSSAFVALSDRYSKRVLLKIYRITNNWQDAEDVLQDSLIKAFTHIDTFECRASFSTWLTRIAINTALMLRRKKKGFVSSAIDSAIDDGASGDRWEFKDHGEDPEQHCARLQRINILRGAMPRLRPELRRTIELQLKGDLSIEELAQSLDISKAAAKSRLLRARILLTGFVQQKARRNHACSGIAKFRSVD
jgi:RNA polymerase sigma-70 factor (ECF subfamily)